MSDIEENAHFCVTDLPEVQIPAELNSASESDNDLESGPSTQNTIDSTTTLVSQLEDSVNSIEFSESDSTASFPVSAPKSRKNRYPQRFSRKRKGIFRTPPKVKAKRINVSAASASKLLKGCHFPKIPVPFNVQLKEGDKISSRPLYVPHGTQLMNMDILCKVFQLIKCPEPMCSGSLSLHKYPHTDGLQAYFVVHCYRCHTVIARFPTSLHLGESPDEAVNNPRMLSHRTSEVNIRTLLALHTTSASWTDFRLTCAWLDLQMPGKNLKPRALQEFVEITAQVASHAMDLAAAEVRSRKNAVPSVIEGVTRCHVTFDASWHMRGHYSNQGFGAAIDSISGKVLDYELLQRLCSKCATWSDERQASFPEEYAKFKEQHTNCTINFAGTSQAMEGAIAIDLWKRSVARNRLAYITYIGDGDSSAFKRVVDSNPYDGLESIRKEECLGHLQKRLKKRLMEKSRTSPAIPKYKSEKIGQLYGLVVLQNRGNSPEDIRKALWTLVGHLQEDHTKCPINSTTWCYFQRAQAEFALDPSQPLPKRHKPYCTETEIARLEEVFKLYASLKLCSALTMGKTQNANESLHSVVWHNSPKAKYLGQKSMMCSTALAVTSFNEGSLSLAAILLAYGIIPSGTTLRHLAARDQIRNQNRKQAMKGAQKRRRRMLHAKSQALEFSRLKIEKSSSKYSSDKFGTEYLTKPTKTSDLESGEESDTICSRCTQRSCPIGRVKKVDDWIGCDICQRWYHAKCIGVEKVSTFTDAAFFCEECQDFS